MKGRHTWQQAKPRGEKTTREASENDQMEDGRADLSLAMKQMELQSEDHSTRFEPVTSTMRIDLDALSGLTRPQSLEIFLHYMRAIFPRVSFTLFTPKGEQN